MNNVIGMIVCMFRVEILSTQQGYEQWFSVLSRPLKLGIASLPFVLV